MPGGFYVRLLCRKSSITGILPGAGNRRRSINALNPDTQNRGAMAKKPAIYWQYIA
jgi:hypothetical protein